MRGLLTIALLTIAFSAQADHTPSEPPLTDESKLLRVQILGEALRNKGITQ
ncbi:MAG: hypothetical protein M3P47_00065 [Pseudomonadota bacterium]|nr:hypothetical protein [Pseudomonadota bacterium]